MNTFVIKHPTWNKWKNIMKKLIVAIILSLGAGFGFSYISFDNFLHIGWYQFFLVMSLFLAGCTLEYFHAKNKKEEDPEAIFAFLVLACVVYAVVGGVTCLNDQENWQDEHYEIAIQCIVCENYTVLYQEKGKFWGELDSESCDNCGLRLDVMKHPEYLEKLEAFESLQKK